MKKLLTFFLALMATTATLFAESGTCGANVNWVLDEGVLTISGTGPMTEYGSPNALPWYDLRSSIISVIVEDGVTSISKNLCYSYTALEEVTIGNGVTSIGDYAFYGCTSLNSLTIGHSLTTIGVFAFGGCTVLPEISLPNSLITIGQSAFDGCSALTEVTIGDNVTSIGEGAFKNCTALTEVTIGNKVESIGDAAFQKCSKITSLTIGNSVTSIGQLAFFYCSALTSLTLPASLTTIGENGFRYCWSLTEITCNATTPPSCGSEALANISTTIPVYVPFGTKSAYEGADEWKRFTNIKASVSGTCGENVNWVLDEGVLTISGTGDMVDYATEDEVPWYPYVSSITNVIIEDGVTTIGNRAFYNCNNLTDLSIGNDVTSIGDYAFYYCESLSPIILPDGVTTIGEFAFSYCGSLSTIILPDGVTTIPYGLFSDCYSLAEVTLGANVTTIEDGAFGFCEALTTITLPENLTSIGNAAFMDCHVLQEITIPNSVTILGEDAFNNCSSLTAVTIGSGITTIEKGTFASCGLLEEVTIPDNIIVIGEDAFYNCISLASVTIPENVVSIDYHAFYYCSGLTEITCKPTMPPTCSSAAFESVDNSIPVYVPYGSVDAYAMATGWNYFTGIQLKVDASGTCGESVNWLLTDGLLVIYGTGPMTDFEHYNDAPWYGYRDDITTVIVEDGVTTIGDQAFNVHRSLTSVTIGNDVITIGKEAFYSCEGLTSVTIGNSVTIIGDAAFKQCVALTSVTIPNSVTTIVENAFSYCTALTSVTIGEGVTTIGNSAFMQCTALTSVTIPNSVTTIDEYAFSQCTALTSVTIPNSVITIGKEAFSECSHLTSVTIGNGLTSIGNYAFYSCSALTEITCEATTPPTCTSFAFDGVDNTIPVYVPAAVVETYKETEGWNYFTNITGYITGTCGANATWLLKGNVLIISGIGQMTNYTYASSRPWHAYAASITTVIVEDGITSIGESAFDGFTALTSATIGSTVEYIYGFAFIGCTALTEITLPSSLTDIYPSAFKYAGFTSLLIPENVIYIGNEAFSSCEALTEITSTATTPPSCSSTAFNYVNDEIPVIVPIEAQSAYRAAEGWNHFVNIQSTGSCGENVNWTLNGDVLTISGTGAMANYEWDYEVPWYAVRSTITTVTIEEGVTTIGDAAFIGCDLLSSVTIPNSITTIGVSAFNGCGVLTSVTLPASVTSLGDYAFQDCVSLTEIISKATTPPTCVVAVFNGVDNNIPVYVAPGTVQAYSEAVGWIEFTNIQGIDYEELIDGIRYFLNGTDLTAQVIDLDGDKYVGNIVVPEEVTFNEVTYAVTSVSSPAFLDCPDLLTVSLPKTITWIEPEPFQGNTKLTAINVDAANTEYSSIDGVLFNKAQTELIAYPTGKTGAYVVPEGVEAILDGAFIGNVNLTAITMPASMYEISSSAFANCTGLTMIACLATDVPGAGSDVFYGVDKSIPVFVPKASIALYQAEDEWKDFTNYIAAEDKAAADEVVGKIDAIGTVVFTPGCKALIEEARAAYDALTAAQKPLVANYATLTAAEAAYAELVKEHTYTVTFKDWDDAPLKEEAVLEGNSATAPDDPKREGYTFTGWDKDFSNVTDNMTVTAQYEMITSGDCGAYITWTYDAGTHTLTISGTGFMTNYDAYSSYYAPWFYIQLSGESIEHIVLSEGITSIGDFAFTFLTDITSITIPSGVGVIGNWAFAECASLTSVTIPASVTTIQENAFNNCTALKEVYNYNTDPIYIASNVFGSVDIANCELHVPYLAVSDYEKAAVWKDFLLVAIQKDLTVTFVDYDATELKSETVKEGEAAIAPSDPTREGYTFTGWDKDFSVVLDNMTVTAQYTINVYTVTFVDKDGKTLKTENVEWGNAATAPDAPAVEGWTFSGWDKAFNVVKSDLTVQAQYAINTYTVTFVDYDGTELKSETVEWGENATAPAEPTREGYTFIGWDEEYNNVTEDLTVTAQYAINIYTVTFLDKDGNTLKTEDVEWGNAATAPDAPAVEGYHFAGWDKAFNVVKSDLTVQATYTKNPVYTVTFKDYDGSTIAEVKVEEGKAAVSPDEPIREGYTFIGWDEDFSNVTSDLTVTAQYTINVYTVTFVDKDGKTLKTEKVEYGKAATAPDAPAVAGYHFTGWDKKFDKVTSDLTVTAQYAINVYTVTFYDKDDNIIKTEEVEWGKAATAPEPPVVEGYHFTGWDAAFDNIKQNTGIYALYEINVYTVIFLDKDGKNLKTEKVEHGKSATAPDAPAVEGYHFTGWDKDFSTITADLTVKAQYAINVYTVTFLDKEGKTIKTEKVEHGSAATAPDAPAVEGYHFTNWDKKFDNVTSNLTVKAQYAINVYTVRFVDKDLKTLKTEKVEHGKSATAPDAPAVEGYHFTGWNKSFDKVTSDLTVIAQYAINTYTVTFVDFDNKELKTETVEHGKAATAPADPKREGYTFKGWDKDFSNITADLTVKAQYTINTYTVTFIDKDGKTIKTQKVEWGKAATAPEAPVVAGWTFAGWDKAFNVVKSDLTVQATYTKNPVYTVTFKDYDGSIIAEVKVEEGKAAVKPNDPIREGYTFTGWDKKFDNVKSDLTVTAQYAINTYTVTFVDYNDKELKKETVEWGKSATAPADPKREGYTFKGWDKDYSNIKADLTVKALYAINTYTVTFVDYDNKELKKETVEHGKAATAPSNPTREGYTFKGWDKDFSNITADLTVKAQYTINTYTVTFLDKDGNTLKTEKVKYGKSATAPEPPVVEGWTFAGWDKAFNVITSDLTVQATYTQNAVYTVTFKDYDGSIIAEVKVEKGKSAVKPDDPIREGYTFTGWDKDFSNVTSDLTVTAQYAINVYTVTFLDKDGKTLKTEKVEHGKSATAPETPAVEGYHFTGWDKSFDKVTADLTVTAQYAINVYTVKFVDKDGKNLKTEKVEHGKAATAPEAPEVEGWTFAGWDKAFNVVTSDLTVKATYTQNHVYTVTFKDYDGSTIAEVKVEEGKSAVKPDDPIREGYTFIGWDKDFSNVTSDLTVTAQYAINVYTVKFIDKDGKTLKTEKVEYGKSATAPDAPAVEGYHFTGWDKSFDKVTSDLTVKALYEINVYTVKFVDKDGKTIKTEKVEHGKAATAPEAPEVEGYHFAGWDKAFNVVTSDLTVQATYTQNTVYTVTFVDYDGSIIAEVKVEEGKSAVKPNDPIREGYAFIGWDKDFSNVTSDMTVTALYEALSDFVPQNLTVELVGVGESDTQITLSWDAVEGAFSYDLRLAIGEKELFTRNTMTLTSLTALLSQIEEQYHLTPGTYLIDWFVRSTDKNGEAISEWAQGESFEVTIKEPQGIEEITNDQLPMTNTRKQMRNGLLYIIRGDRTYDSNGRLIQ